MTFFSEDLFVNLVGVILLILASTVAFFNWRFNYWAKRGLPSLNPTFPFGDAKDMFSGKITFGIQFAQIYNKLKSRGYKHGGVFLGTNPVYVPIDPEIIKHIMQTDFNHFVNRGTYLNEKDDPLSGHLFNLEDAKWKNMRNKLTPTFTSGKMKMMFQTLADCTKGLKEIMDDSAKSRTSIDIKDVLGRFTTDIIGSVAFGLDCNTLKEPDALLREYGKKVFLAEGWFRVKIMIQFVFPHNFLRAIGFKLTQSDVEAFFMQVIKDTVNYREKNNLHRKDFMHLLLQLKNRGEISDDGKISENGQLGEKALTINELAAQAFVFFVAGFETSSTTMTFALYEIAVNNEVQAKLRREVQEVLKKYDGKLTYEGVMEMHYMDKVISETLRKYPPVPMLPRVCTQDYTIPGTDIVIERGTDVAIAAMGIQNDPEFYPEPEKFDPERFSEENKNTRPAITWIPFGEGPRICIGLRFGIMQSKVGLAALLCNYKIKLSQKTQLPIKFDRKIFITSVEGGVWIDVETI